MELSAVDVAILRSLERDARQSLRDVAKAVGVSTPTVSARLATLEALGIVRGYRAVLDPERLNETSVGIVVRTRPQAADRVAAAIAALPASRRVAVARGGRVLADATVADTAELNAFLDAVSALRDVVDVEHHVLVRSLKDEPRAVVADRLTANLACFECKGPIKGEPVKARRDGRELFFCCTSCERLFLERYDRTAARAAGTARRPRRKR